MAGIIELLRLVVKLIKSPVYTIKGTDIISYDKDAMLRLFSIVSAINCVFAFSIFYERLNLAAIMFLIILAPFIMFLVFNISAVIYYASFKMFGKGIEAKYDSVKTALYPLFLTSLIISIFISQSIRISPYIYNMLRHASNIWFYAMTFLLLKYKLRQTTTRSILISVLPMLLGIVLGLIRIVDRL